MNARGSDGAPRGPLPRTLLGGVPRAGLLLVGLLLGACAGDDEGSVRTIAKTRVYELVGKEIPWGASTEERFGMRRSMPGAPGMAGGGGGGSGGLHWSTPPGWTEVAPTALRQVNLLVDGDPRAECYLTVLSGDGGGIAANVNRWRRQMSLPELPPEEIDALPRVSWWGGEAVFVDLEGVFTGMGGDQMEEDHRLVGLAMVGDGQARFLKMIGPQEVLRGELEAFRALAASIHEDAPGAHGGDPHAGVDGGEEDPHAGLAGGDDPHAGLAGGEDPHAGLAPSPTTAPAAGESAQGLAWDTPEGWRRGADRPMRVVTLRAGPDDEAECYVSVLGGDGGGALANINRWRRQMGEPPLSELELADLPGLPMLGTEAILVEVAGSYRGMGNAELSGAMLLGAVCNLPDRAVYVKMIGPRSVVEAEREAFRAFCRSLELRR